MNEDKHLSFAGAAYLKQLEEPGGRCRLKAYNDGGNTPTIAWGCTHGVHYGMTITEDQGLTMFNVEIADIEDGLRKWATRELDQDTWDVCVMFGYNCGWGKCQAFKAAVNSGDPAKFRAAEMLFTHGYSQAAGRTIEWPGLVSRRKQELAYWDGHHNLLGNQAPAAVHVGEEAPKINVTAPPKPNIVVTAGKSRTVWAQISAGMATGFYSFRDSISGLFHFPIPPADNVQGFVDQTQSSIDTSRQVAGWFHLNAEHLVVFIVLGVIAYTIIRRALDKQEQVL